MTVSGNVEAFDPQSFKSGLAAWVLVSASVSLALEAIVLQVTAASGTQCCGLNPRTS